MKEEKKDFSVQLAVNGKDVRLNRFAQDIFALAITGMIGALKDVPSPETIEVTVRAK